MKPLSVMVKVEPQQQMSSPSTPSTNSSSNNTNNNSNIGHVLGNNNNNIMMMNPSHSIYPSCLPLAAKGTSSSFIPSHPQQQQQPQQHAFSLPSIHNLTSQQPSPSKVMVDHIHHYGPPPQSSWRGEPKPPLISNNGGHDLMEALSTQTQTVVRYAPPIYQAIIQPSIDIVPMDSFIPGYISGYRGVATPQQITVGSTPEMQPSNPSPSTGVVVTSTGTPVKVSQHHVAADHELLNIAKVSQAVVASSVSQQASSSNNNNTTQQPPSSSSADASQARMACINCRKSHRKW